MGLLGSTLSYMFLPSSGSQLRRREAECYEYVCVCVIVVFYLASERTKDTLDCEDRVGRVEAGVTLVFLLSRVMKGGEEEEEEEEGKNGLREVSWWLSECRLSALGREEGENVVRCSLFFVRCTLRVCEYVVSA